MSMIEGINIVYLRRYLFTLVLMAGSSLLVYGTHNRAGEITYEQLDDLSYRITVITYTATGPGPVADRPSLTVQFGDGMSAEVPRIEEIFLPDYYKRNKLKRVLVLLFLQSIFYQSVFVLLMDRQLHQVQVVP